VEVKNAFLKHIMFSLTRGVTGEESSKFVKLATHLEKGNFNAFFETMTAIFADFPYPPDMQPDESYFLMLFYLTVSASGMNAQSEILAYRDCIDLFVAFSDKIFVMD